MEPATFVTTDMTHVFPREFDRVYPLIVRGEGMWLYDATGRAYLDALGGGAMVCSIGHNVPEIIEAAEAQARKISFLYNQQFTSPAQEQLAAELCGVAPPGMTRVHFTSGGSEANETALRLIRSYHVERGEASRTRIITQAQAYHGPTMATLGLTGRPALRYPYDPYIQNQLYVPPSTWRFDPTGQLALEAVDAHIEREGAESIAAFMCEPVSAAALPAYTPPEAFWRGLAERRERHGFLIALDEVVTGLGRTGSWFAADRLPFVPDIIATAKGLGAGFAPVGAVIAAQHVFDAVADGSRNFEAGHTWDGAPLPCAVGVAVIAYLKDHGLIDAVRERGPGVRRHLEDALGGSDIVREVRGQGFLFGIEYVDPRDGESFLPPELGVARRIDVAALENEVLLYSTQPTVDGYAGDQTLLAPAFTATDAEIGAMVERVAASVATVEAEVKHQLISKDAKPVAV